MNGETLTYDEIVERSRKYLEKKEKKALIAFIIMGIIIFVFVLLLAKELALACFCGAVPIVVGSIWFLATNKDRKYGINGKIEQYKDIINNYNLVFNGFREIYTKSHIIYFYEDYDTTTWSVHVICLNDIESITLKKAYLTNHTYFFIYVKNGKSKRDKLKIATLPDVFKEILKDYIVE